MKSLWSVSLVTLLFCGCVSIKPSHLTPYNEVMSDAPNVTQYKPPATSHLFKATLDIRKHHLTGLLIIKSMDTLIKTQALQQVTTLAPSKTGSGGAPGRYRFVFMNEVGMTFFDLEMKADSFKVVSCFSSLNKKALMKILETDFRMLTWTGSPESTRIYRQEKSNNIIVSGNAGKYKTWRTYSPPGDTLYSISAKSTIADPVIISFSKYTKGFPGNIIIENPFIGMKLSLRKLTR